MKGLSGGRDWKCGVQGALAPRDEAKSVLKYEGGPDRSWKGEGREPWGLFWVRLVFLGLPLRKARRFHGDLSVSKKVALPLSLRDAVSVSQDLKEEGTCQVHGLLSGPALTSLGGSL